MRRVALFILATALWLGSQDQAGAQSRMGGQCAGHSASSSSSQMMNNSPGFSAFNANGSTLTNGNSLGAGMSSLTGGGFGSNLDFAAANGMSGGFNYGFGMGTINAQADMDSVFFTGTGMCLMNGQSYAQAAGNDNEAFATNAFDPESLAIKSASTRTNTTQRMRPSSKRVKSRAKSKAKTSKSRPR